MINNKKKAIELLQNVAIINNISLVKGYIDVSIAEYDKYFNDYYFEKSLQLFKERYYVMPSLATMLKLKEEVERDNPEPVLMISTKNTLNKEQLFMKLDEYKKSCDRQYKIFKEYTFSYYEREFEKKDYSNYFAYRVFLENGKFDKSGYYMSYKEFFKLFNINVLNAGNFEYNVNLIDVYICEKSKEQK
ncbi:MAG: hypothetical protein Ta2D_14010 [Rickettsiales bacterium]|nr:MAG: hypothetical protein Ta2D_14010 [Rickettsiales bacterium]